MKREKKAPETTVKIAVDTVNEVVLITAVITDEKARKRYLNIPGDYFHGPGHAEMWTALQELYRRGLEYSAETMRTLAGEKFDVAVLEDYLSSRPSTPANLKHHVDNLRWDKSRVEAARGPVPTLIDLLRDPNADREAVSAAARQVGDCFKGASDLRYLRSTTSIAREHSYELDARREGRAVYPYGIPGLDLWGPGDTEQRTGKEIRQLEGKPRMVPGAAPGLVTVITGVSGSGKTSVTARMINEQCDRKRKVLWGAWEQMPGMSLELVAMLNLGFSRTEIMTGQYSKEDQADLIREMERLGEYLEFFELPFGRERGEKGEYFNDRNLDLIHQYIAESGAQVFVGDVFKYALREVRPDEEDFALKRMRAIAMETRCHMFLIQHLSLKEVERRADKRPTRDALMGSTGWINVGDTVIGIHARHLFESVPAEKIEFHILKQRFGRWPLTVECDWDGEYGSIEGGRTMQLALPGEHGEVDEWLAKDDGARRGNGRGKGRGQWRR